MARIRIYIGRHLCTAPRPQKEANALAAAGHEVSVHGIAFDPGQSARDRELAAGRRWRWEPVADYTKRRAAWLGRRLRHRAAKEWFRLTGHIDGDVWSYANTALAVHALRAPADLTIVHAEGGLWFAQRLLARGCCVGVDFEDWFSRDLTLEQQRGRPVAELARLEGELMRRCTYRLAPSRAMAAAMAKACGTTPPEVIYNTFPAGDAPPEPRPGAHVSLHWFSLVLGPDRGLETLASALPLLQGEWELHLRGEPAPGYRDHWLASVPARLHARIRFHPTVPAAALPGILRQHDIGLALDVSTIPSRNLTVTNKLFHYLQAGLAVAASDTAGHREVLDGTGAGGANFPSGDAPALAQVLNRWIADRDRLRTDRLAARAAFEGRFAHERQAHRYGELAARALHA